MSALISDAPPAPGRVGASGRRFPLTVSAELARLSGGGGTNRLETLILPPAVKAARLVSGIASLGGTRVGGGSSSLIWVVAAGAGAVGATKSFGAALVGLGGALTAAGRSIVAVESAPRLIAIISGAGVFRSGAF